MAQLRLALAQINPVVGDLDGNADLVLRVDPAAPPTRGAHLVAFPEMALTGYPVEDLALRASFVDASRADPRTASPRSWPTRARRAARRRRLPRRRGRTPCPVARARPKGAPQNAAAVLHRGRVAARYAKHHLPNYGVFDEYRYFVPGQLADGRPGARRRRRRRDLRGHLAGRRPGRRSPARPAPGCWWSSTARRTSGTRTTSGSPSSARRAAEAGCALAYVNMVGGQDELVFDGDSLVVAADGERARPGRAVRRATCWSSTSTCPTPRAGRRRAEPRAGAGRSSITVERIVRARRRCRPASPAPRRSPTRIDGRGRGLRARWSPALRDYVAQERLPSRSCSASPAASTRRWSPRSPCDALGAANVLRRLDARAATRSEHSRADAADLAERTGLHYQTVPIAPMVDAFLADAAR